MFKSNEGDTFLLKGGKVGTFYILLIPGGTETVRQRQIDRQTDRQKGIALIKARIPKKKTRVNQNGKIQHRMASKTFTQQIFENPTTTRRT